ncbi:MAG: hypothetical protein ACRD3W_14640 [Terriglobales bacterium]
MYWRIRKIGPEQIAKQYGVHAGLIFSVLVNVVLITTRPAMPKVAPETKMSFEQFAKTVTQHLLDTSYITYTDSTASLLNGELAPPVIALMRQQETLAKSNEELRAIQKKLEESQQVSAVKIEQIIDSDLDPNGMLPVEVRGIVAIHSAEETGPAGPEHFDFKFLVGARPGPDGKPLMMADGHTPMPLVARFEDASPKPTGN